MHHKKSKKTIKRFFIVIFVFLFLIFGGFYIYTLDYYRADDIATTAFAQDKSSNTIETKGNYKIITPTKPNGIGFIFYPGGKVEDIAYLPLLNKLSLNGITCVIVKMPFNLAVFGINSADEVYSMLPNIKTWYIGGHSLGGAMASSYAIKNMDKISGLVLLASYPIKPVNMSTIEIHGSNDGVLNRKKLDLVENKVEIEGGNHAQFGDYGEQKGDNKATITTEEQQSQCVDTLLKFFK